MLTELTQYKKFFANQSILLIGGTGSIGSKILEALITYKPKKIKIFSRDEYKQHQLRYTYAHLANIEYYLGDIRDIESLRLVAKNTDVLFHCAALKHVPMSEEMPEEFIKTNILGSLNIKKVALEHEIPTVVSISTDKAVESTNVMGLTKAIQEKIFSSHVLKEEKNNNMRFVNVRFGNVIGTHGSLFPILYHQIKNNIPITITVGEMTRFFMSEHEAIQLVLWSALYGEDGSTVIKKMKSVRVDKLIQTFIKQLTQKNNYPVQTIGIRVGEKIHESLISAHELPRTTEKNGFYSISPYSKKEIAANVIKPLKRESLALETFSSNNAANTMKDKELIAYIDRYISDVSKNTNYI